MNKDSTQNTEQQQSSKELDSVWNLLDQSESLSNTDYSPQAKPLFARDVLRSIRKLEDSKKPSWAALLFKPLLNKTVVTSSLMACLALIVFFNQDSTTEQALSIDEIAEEIQAIENENPLYLSADDIDWIVNFDDGENYSL